MKGQWTVNLTTDEVVTAIREYVERNASEEEIPPGSYNMTDLEFHLGDGATKLVKVEAKFARDPT